MMITLQTLGFIHRFIPAEASGPTIPLLLLHGTGGDENDMLPLGRMLLPGAALLSPRGKVLENGMPRFFRRLAPGKLDLEDLKFRTHELAEFVEKASTAYGFDLKKTLAVGFSNGANIGASIILLRPRLLVGAVLFHPMIPLVPLQLPNLMGIPIFISAGRQDPYVSSMETKQLVTLFEKSGAEVNLTWQEGGHALIEKEIEEAKKWLTQYWIS